MRVVLMIWLSLLIFTNCGFAKSSMAVSTMANVDWGAAIAAHKSLSGDHLDALRSEKAILQAGLTQNASSYSNEPFAADLRTLNAATAIFRPEIAFAGTPVLLPFEFGKFAKDIKSGPSLQKVGSPPSYFEKMTSLAFHPGPYGYRAYFRLQNNSTIVIAGSSIFYNLDKKATAPLPQLKTCSEIIKTANRPDTDNDFFVYLEKYERDLEMKQAEFFGEREAVVPCLFAGALVELHILCDSQADPDCLVRSTAKDIFALLTFVGGSPRPKAKPDLNDPIGRLQKLVDDLEGGSLSSSAKNIPEYGKPGDLLASTAEGDKGGSDDKNIYGPILFPTHISAAAQTVVFREGEKCLGGKTDGPTCTFQGNTFLKAKPGLWQDNFCESRGRNKLFTCPAGMGHAGQDVWGADWRNKPGKFRLRAAVDGVAFRRFPRQPAVTISDVNGSNIDYVYRHMRPTKLTENGILPSMPRAVKRGCTLALVDQLQSLAGPNTVSKIKDGRSSYEITPPHLHFEIRIPTKVGFQHVSPYQTLVSAHRASITKVDAGAASIRPCRLEPL